MKHIMDATTKLGTLEKLRTLPVILAIFLLGFSVVYLSHGPRLSDPDAWFQYKMAQYVLEDGGVPEVYPLAYYPDGRRPWSQDTLFLPYFFAYTYKLVAPLGPSLMEWAMLFPAVMQGLAAVALFLAVRELWNARVAMLSALIYSFMPLALSRVYSGTIDKEVLYGVFTYGSLYFFMLGYKSGIHFDKPKSLVAPLLAGIFYGISYANWSGGAYLALVIAVAAVLHLVFERDVELMKSVLAIAVIGPVVMHLIQPDRFSYGFFIQNSNSLIPFAVGFLPLSSAVIYERLKGRGRDVHYLNVMIGMMLAAVVFLYAVGMGSTVEGLLRVPINYIAQEKSTQQDLYMATVAESQPSRFLGSGDTIFQRIKSGDIYPHLGAMLFIIPIGIVILLNRLRKDPKDFPSVFALVWIASGFLAANQGLRLLFFLAPSAAAIAGYTFADIFAALKSREKEVIQALRSSLKAKIKQRAESKAANVRAANIVWLFVALAASLSTLEIAVASINRQSDLPTPWYEALMWTKNNTPKDSVIFFWWDYGYYFQAVAERRTVADGGGNVMRNINLANMFASSEDEAMRYIRKYVDYEKTPTYMLVSYEEFGKSGAINRIAAGDPEMGATRFDGDGRMKDGQIYIGNFQVPRTGNFAEDEKAIGNALARDRISTYYIVNAGDHYIIWALVQFDQNGNYHPEWSDKLLPKLLPFNTGYGQGLKHFELVYQDQWNYILIYRIK